MENRKNKDDIIQLTEDCVSTILNVWGRTFDDHTCQDNVRRLYDHAENFYNDLINESIQKETYIKNEISELQNEAQNLQRLLKIEVKLPDILNDQNMPLLVIERELDKSLTELREQLRQRRAQICELLLEQESLCEELGEPPQPLLADPLPMAEEIEQFRCYLESLKEEKMHRMQRLVAIRREIKNNLKILNLNINTDADDQLLNHRQIKLSKETFNSLEKLHQRFSEQVEALKVRIDSMRQKLPSLWDRLNTPEEERHKIERYNEYTQVTCDILYQELERCEDLKRQNIKHYIKEVRKEIVLWWDKTLKSEKERMRFTHLYSHDYSDELLTLHELEFEDIKQYFETNKQIFELFEGRKILWERMTALEQKASDPGRYNNRGGQLLKEEKERKTIATKLPKIEQQIIELVEEYTQREHASFLVYGENIIDVMAADWEKKRQEKEAHTNARKNAVTPQSHGPNRSQMTSVTRVPLTQRTVSSAALRKTPSSTCLSVTKNTLALSSAQKRKLHPSDKTTPKAKRSLWNSPSEMFKMPTTPASTAKQMTSSNQAKNKMPRFLATTIRRRSGRYSNTTAATKRRSLKKSANTGKNKIPKILLSSTSTSVEDENYDTFRDHIEPASRSSIRHESLQAGLNAYKLTKLSDAKKRRQQQKLAEKEKERITALPQPQIFRTPSKQGLRSHPVSPGLGTSSILYGTTSGSSRKLTTKNLPIII